MSIEGMSQPGTLETDSVKVRTMRDSDLEAVIAIDAAATGHRRPSYFRRMLERAVKDADFKISLVAELEGVVAGCIIATLYYGEYGVMEPWASIETIGVLPALRRRHVGKALLRQLRMNLGALQIEKIRTQLTWNNFELLHFFETCGFEPGDQVCLELTLDPTAPDF
jgi:ribosomal protein S18 acetylase RimI-like enzyme